MQSNKLIAQILLPIAFDKAFSYYVPDDLTIKTGDVVLVNFVNRYTYGVVTCVTKEQEKPSFKIKNIKSKDDAISINTNLIELIDFASNYNLSPKGLFLKLAISTLNNSKNQEISDTSYTINANPPQNIKITPKRQKIIDVFNENPQLSAQNLIKSANISSSTLSSLVKNDFIIKTIIKQKTSNYETQTLDPSKFNLKKLSKSQQSAADFIAQRITENKYSTTLIDGITGSGKTEVYFDSIAKILKEDLGQILILLPEIILAEQLVKRFISQFNFTPHTWNSKVSNAQKRKTFYSISNNNIKILIGTRSALFLPFSNLKLIIIDEEHESSFKQEDIVNYHGRDMAIARAKFENIPILLSSATPSIETYVNAKKGKYHHLVLENKFFNKDKALVQIVDMKKETIASNQHISDILKKEISNSLDNNEQILLFLNRRGYAPLTLCKSCGFKISCINCSSYITYHQKINKSICHHCGYEAKTTLPCQSCKGSSNFITIGAGVEKIAEEVTVLFPDSKIALMTSDNLNDSTKASQIIEEISANKIDIIIGTQIIAKGHHFPHLALVGIIDGDGSFNNANLRASEKSFQLLTQVIGRAGRERHNAKIILQSYNTSNLVFKYIASHNRNDFLDLEIKNRKILQMPPFGKMIAIIFISKIESQAINSAKLILRKFPTQQSIEIFGPAPMPISRIRKHYYHQLLIKSDKKLNIQKLVQRIVQTTKLPSQVRVKIDVDPT